MEEVEYKPNEEDGVECMVEAADPEFQNEQYYDGGRAGMLVITKLL